MLQTSYQDTARVKANCRFCSHVDRGIGVQGKKRGNIDVLRSITAEKNIELVVCIYRLFSDTTIITSS